MSKTTNNLTPQFWGKRKPMTKYFQSGYILFSVDRKTKQLHYSIQVWSNRNILILVEKGVVKDTKHLNQLLGAKNFIEAVEPHKVHGSTESKNC